jgi:hypothetical protein
VLIFFSSAMKIGDAVAKYDDDLRRAADAISHDLISADTAGSEARTAFNFHTALEVEARA